jgi:MoaA/NifB/PqqE/SkfB family radical SAM enzyme
MKLFNYYGAFFNKDRMLPASLVFFVTNRCNARCRHCFYWKKLNQKNDSLSLEEIRKISSSLSDLLLLVLGGGEPFLRDDLPTIAEIFHQKNRVRNLVIPTNGLLSDKICEFTEKILIDCKNLQLTLYLSIDNIGRKHDDFRGVDDLYCKALATFAHLKKLEHKYANLDTGILLSLNPENQDEIIEIYSRIYDDFRPRSISPVLMRSISQKLNSKDVDISKYDRLLHHLNKEMVNGHIAFHGRNRFSNLYNSFVLNKMKVISNTVKHGFQIPCYAGRLSAVLYEDGSLFPCEVLNMPMGNIRDYNYDFNKIWFSPDALKIKDYILKSHCHCTYECAVDINLFFNCHTWFNIFYDYVMLQLKK